MRDFFDDFVIHEPLIKYLHCFKVNTRNFKKLTVVLKKAAQLLLYLERRYLERRYLKPKYLEPKF